MKSFLFLGIFWSAYPVIVVDLIGEERKDYAVSQAFACFSVSWFGAGPLGGR